eukprot:1779098-Pleurochrysis_carterae.AAC.3
MQQMRRRRCARTRNRDRNEGRLPTHLLRVVSNLEGAARLRRPHRASQRASHRASQRAAPSATIGAPIAIQSPPRARSAPLAPYGTCLLARHGNPLDQLDDAVPSCGLLRRRFRRRRVRGLEPQVDAHGARLLHVMANPLVQPPPPLRHARDRKADAREGLPLVVRLQTQQIRLLLDRCWEDVHDLTGRGHTAPARHRRV